VSRGAQALDDFVSSVIVARLSLPDAIDVFTPHRASIDIAAIRSELAGIDEQRTQLGTRLGRGEISMAMLDAANAPLRARQTHLEAALAAATETDPLTEVVTSDDVAAAWANLDLDRRRTILDTLLVVTVHPTQSGRRRGGGFVDPSSIQITWKTNST
jgi:hypothetical protein